MLIEKKSCGSIIKIDTKDQKLSENILYKIFSLLNDFENKYSRFIAGNFLYKLNQSGKAKINSELKTIFKVCKYLNNLTNGYFDITILPILENYGYGIEKKIIKESFGMNKIEILGDDIILNDGVRIDFGAIGKGYLVDQVYSILIKHLDFFSINFGGDIKIGKQDEIIGLEDPFNEKIIIGEIIVSQESICSSSGEKRKFGNYHHIINPFSKHSQSDKLIVYTKHKLATLADSYSTALFVTPLNKSVDIIENTKGLEALIISKTGEIYKSIGFNAILY